METEPAIHLVDCAFTIARLDMDGPAPASNSL
jgi:hypothetical protein